MNSSSVLVTYLSFLGNTAVLCYVNYSRNACWSWGTRRKTGISSIELSTSKSIPKCKCDPLLKQSKTEEVVIHYKKKKGFLKSKTLFLSAPLHLSSRHTPKYSKTMLIRIRWIWIPKHCEILCIDYWSLTKKEKDKKVGRENRKASEF